MTITAQQYERVKKRLAEQGGELSPDVREKALAAVTDFENSFLNKATGGQPRPEGDAIQVIPQGGAMPTADTFVQDVKRKLDPSLPVQPQVLSIQPSTTHPKGDEAAKEEWVRGDVNNPNGLVVVYDAPAATVRRKIMENPQLLKAIGFEAPLSPEAIATIETGDAVHEAYNNYMWHQVADAGVKGGKTPYRYSKAPWMAEGKGASTLDSLSTKLKTGVLPALNQATAFVMGEDELASFGLATQAARSGALDDDEYTQQKKAENAQNYPPRETVVPGAKPMGEKDEVVGAIDSGDTGEDLDAIREEYPKTHAAGQVVGAVPGAIEAGGKLVAKGASKAVGALGGAAKAGAEAVEGAVGRGLEQLSHWNPANSLWEWITSKTPTAVPGGVGASLLGAAKTVGSGAAAAGAHQLGNEAVKAGAELASTGETGSTVRGAAGRVLDAAKMGAIATAPVAAVQGVANVSANYTRNTPRYQGLPRELEELGVEPQLGRGYAPTPAIRQATEEAAQRGVKPIDVLTERMEKPIAAATREQDTAAKLQVKGENQAYYKTGEGQQRLPAENLTSTSLDLLRQRMASERKGKRPTAVGVPNADNPVRGIFNSNIQAVSTTESKGAIRLSPEEAQAFLNPSWRRRAVAAVKTGKAQGRPAAGPAQKGGSREIDPSDIEAGGAAENLAQEMKGKPIWVTPRRYDAQHHETAIRMLRKKSAESQNDRDLGQLHQAAMRDRDARSLDGKVGGWSAKQAEHERTISAAKDTTRRVAPVGKPDGTYRAIERVSRNRRGQSKDLDAVKKMAERAGHAETLKNARTLDPLERITGIMSQGGVNKVRAPWSPTGGFDQANLRFAYPASRAVQKSKALRRGDSGRLAGIVTSDKAADARREQREAEGKKSYAQKTEGARKAASKPSSKKVRKKSTEKKVRRKENDE